MHYVNSISTPSAPICLAECQPKVHQSNGELATTSDDLQSLLRAKDMIYPSSYSVTRMGMALIDE